MKSERADAWIRDQDKQVAHMTLAGLGPDAIARSLGITTDLVVKTLRKPQVQKYQLQITALHVKDIRPAMQDVSEAFASSAMEAQQCVLQVMREMRANPDPRAQRVALSSAQDILDRAGHKPTLRVEEAKVHAIHPETLKELGSVLKELKQ